MSRGGSGATHADPPIRQLATFVAASGMAEQAHLPAYVQLCARLEADLATADVPGKELGCARGYRGQRAVAFMSKVSDKACTVG